MDLQEHFLIFFSTDLTTRQPGHQSYGPSTYSRRRGLPEGCRSIRRCTPVSSQASSTLRLRTEGCSIMDGSIFR